MRTFILLSTVILTACGQNMQSSVSDPRSVHGVDPAFASYVNYFVQVKGSQLSYDIPVGFSKLEGNVIGLCTRWSNGFRQIEIDKDYWNSPYTSEDHKIALIFHELGHCDLNRDHDSRILPNGWPKSLMYPYDVGYPLSMQSYYFSELFSPSTSTTNSTLASEDADCVRDIEVVE